MQMDRLHSLKCSCICVIDFLLWNTKDVLKNVHTVLNDKLSLTVKLINCQAHDDVEKA